jgi:CDP-4-dehydro-6-deoxyglucose reductase
MALNADEMDAGFALLCQAAPLENLTIEAREIAAVRDLQVRMFPARVIEKALMAPDVIRLRLKLPASQRLQFLAGQYVDALLKGGKRRAFSIANSPAQEDEIELHIRHVDGGDFTGWVFNELEQRDILRFEGPLGTFFVRHDKPKRPMIMMGGGTGFAPLKSMIADLLEHGDRRPIELYWGARNPQELYLDSLPRQWDTDFDHIRYRRAISDSGHELEEGTFRGLAHNAVLDDHPDLSGFDIYMSGPPAMIESARKAFVKAGVPEERLFYDSFEFGLDVPVSVLAKPH